MRIILFFIINFIVLVPGPGFVSPEKSIKSDIANFYKGHCDLVDIVQLQTTSFDNYIDTLVYYNHLQKNKLIETYNEGFWNGTLEDKLYLSLVKNTKEKYNNIIATLIEIKSNKNLSNQMIRVYEVIYMAHGCEGGMQIIEIYLLNEDNKPFGYICSDGNYIENPPDEGLICKTPEEFYNRNQKNINNYYIIK